MPFNEKHPNFATFLKTISENHAPLVFWIGAGVSADAGLPNWMKLREILAEGALEELVGLPDEEATEKEILLNEASSTNDLWTAFETLKELLGEPAYKAMIRAQLGKSEEATITGLHKAIWQIENTRGVLSLNIDGLETRAHKVVRRYESVVPFFGRDLKNQLHTLKDKKPFIAQLHGHYADRSSWVFTKKELNSQISNSAYRTAIESIFSNFTVIFLGISAEDIAAGGFLHAMSQAGLDCGNHFWITNRNDAATRKWAENAGVLRLQYSVSGTESHTEVIKDMNSP